MARTSDGLKSELPKQMTVRLPEDLQGLLRRAVKRTGDSAEKIIRRALQRELATTEVEGLTPKGLEGDALLAYRFALVAPAPIVVKSKATVARESGSHTVGEIIWANLAYQTDLSLSMPALRGKSLGDLGLVSWERQAMEAGIARVFDFELPEWSVEPIILPGRGKVPYFTHRFVFRALSPTQPFLGDISFDWTRMIPDPQPVAEDLLSRAHQTAWPVGIQSLFLALLDGCCLSVAIKDATGKLMYHNQSFRDLVTDVMGDAASQETLVGRTSYDIFNLSPAHPMMQNELTVLRSNVFLYTYDTLDPEKVGRRVSLRFPIPNDDGVPEYVGTISTDVESQAHENVLKLKTATTRRAATSDAGTRQRSASRNGPKLFDPGR